MTTKIELNSSTKSFYERVHTFKAKYPHWAITPVGRPDHNFIKSPGQFGRYYQTATDEFRVWGFQEPGHRDAFVRAYNAEVWQP